MRAVVYDTVGGPLQVRQVAAPDCPPDAVVVEVRATGICRSDWHAWQGHDADVRLPHVLGHELAGTVARVGTAVSGWVPGAAVTTPFVCACGSCDQCRSGNHQVCTRQTQPGSTYWGSFAEQVVVRQADVNLVALPAGLRRRAQATDQVSLPAIRAARSAAPPVSLAVCTCARARSS